MKKIRIAQIGINRYSHGRDIFLTLRSCPKLFDIAGYALVENEREECREALSVFDGYNELSLEQILSDDSIEAVTIETDEIHLTKYALMAAQAGKHIHMEKPASQSLEDFESLINEMKKSKKQLHFGYMYRYNPFISEAIQCAKRGELGEILSVEAHMSRKDTPELRKWLKAFKGGMMFYLGCHLADLILTLQGEPDEVISLCTSSNENIAPAEDNAFALLKYKNGVSFVKVYATEEGGFERRQLVICTSRSTVEIKPIEIGVESTSEMNFAFRSSKTVYEPYKSGENHLSDAFDRYIPMLTHFCKVVRGECENEYTLDYELQLFRLLLRCCGADIS